MKKIVDAINTLEFFTNSLTKIESRFAELMNKDLVSRIYMVDKSCSTNYIELYLYKRVLSDWHQGINGDIDSFLNDIDQEQLNIILTKALTMVR